MSKLREIKLEIPEDLYSKLDNISNELEKSKNKILCSGLKKYLLDIENMKNGYESMGKVNKEYAEMCLSADNEVMSVWEEKLSESEKSEC